MRGFTLFDGIAVVAAAALAAIVLVPQSSVQWMIRNEDRIVGDLRRLEARVQAHQKAAKRDADKDGVGEYAPLGDVLGDDPGDARRIGDSEVFELDGYRFAVVVPGGRKTPVPAGSAEAVTDWAEITYGVVAWPLRPGETGMLAYLATPHGILRHMIDGYPYGDDPPVPEWTMIDLSAERPRRIAYNGRDWLVPVHLPEHTDEGRGGSRRQR